VNWFNDVDATYRSDLRELNELNFARFDARVEQRIASLESRLNARIDTVEARVEARLVSQEARILGQLDAGLAGLRAEVAKWLFRSWATMMLAIVGLAVTVVLRG
jgi:hypothetical protein